MKLNIAVGDEMTCVDGSMCQNVALLIQDTNGWNGWTFVFLSNVIVKHDYLIT